ncbi:targeting protein for Xklp2 homolog [Limulus polyphemus]|uniref:Targeting protein for Xklp2 homolog n=1 Tax=Limulus polyphemus TaxID=6850 RepID=A0ABM1TPW2_LIMPO|nr:targeting protein for Xklp2 homolog [Limulus polyphemus]
MLDSNGKLEQPESPGDALVCEQEKQEFLTPESSPPNTTNDHGHSVEMVTDESGPSTSSGREDKLSDENVESDVNLEVPPNLPTVSSNLQERKPRSQVNNEGLSAGRTLRSHSLNDKKKGLEHSYPLRWTPARLQNSGAPDSDGGKTPARKKKRRSETQNRDFKHQSAEDNVAVRVKRSFSARTQSANSSMVASTTRRRGGSFNAGSSEVTKVSKLVAPSTPNCLKRALDNLQNKSKSTVTTEDMELLKIGEIKKRLAANRKKYRKFQRKALQGPKPVDHNTSKSQPHCTVVEPFKFVTDDRIKSHSATDTVVKKEKDFVSSLRRNSPNQHQEKPRERITKPVPFKFGENRKRGRDAAPQEEYHSLAEQIKAFHSATPERFHCSRPGTKPKSDVQAKQLVPTIPHTPKFCSTSRHRPVTAISQAQKEELEVEEMKKYKFKARPVNHKIFTQPMTGISKVETKQSTRPEGFQLKTEVRYHLRERNQASTEEPKYEFHAQPLPKKILEGPRGLKEKEHLPLTHPKSPAFALKGRVLLWKKDEDLTEEEENLSMAVIKANPVPHSGIPFRPKLQKKVTQSEPFSFHNKDKERWALKEERIKEELEKERKMRNFRAQPLPSPSQSGLPSFPKKSLTKPEPFQLSTDYRGSDQAARLQREKEEEEERQREAAVFKARPAAVLYKEPFIPAKAQKSLTEFEDLNLHTEQRATEREKFEMWKQQREEELAAELQRRKEQEEEEERARVAQMRIEAVHKAQPVKHFKPVLIKPSDKTLTNPESPVFATRLRVRNNVSY